MRWAFASSASGPRTWPRPCCGRPTRTSARFPIARNVVTARRSAPTMTTTITGTGAGGRLVDSGWRTASRGGWCPRRAGGCDPHSGRAADYMRAATRVPMVRLASPVTGHTRYWYVHLFNGSADPGLCAQVEISSLYVRSRVRITTKKRQTGFVTNRQTILKMRLWCTCERIRIFLPKKSNCESTHCSRCSFGGR